jgi:hypothetical protein
MNKKGSSRLQNPPRQPWRNRLMAGTVSGGATLAVLAALLWLRAEPAANKPAPALLLTRLDESKPPGPPDASELDPGEPQEIAPPSLPQVTAPVITIARTQVADASDLLSASQLAGAIRAGDGGSGGGRCDTARDVQQVLRRDPRVRAAVAGADRLGKASMLWNGDWVRSGGQEGKGLAVVRQAIIWKVAFVPAACRNERIHGTIVLSLADGRTHFAIGAGDWRWSDLLELR